MIEIRSLTHFDEGQFRAVVSGYTTAETYRVSRTESDAQTNFSLTLEQLPEPRAFKFGHSWEDFDRYGDVVKGEFCHAAFDGKLMVGVALASPQDWNRTLWVWEFHVAATHRGQGIGRSLMAAMADSGRSAGLRCLVCETQNTNVPAIRFYRAVGYALEGVDVSYYTNEDMEPGHTVAVFMKLRLE